MCSRTPLLSFYGIKEPCFFCHDRHPLEHIPPEIQTVSLSGVLKNLALVPGLGLMYREGLLSLVVALMTVLVQSVHVILDF